MDKTKVNKIYPNEAYDFNIRDKNLREELFIYRPLSNGNISAKNIVSFLDYEITDKIYMPFWEFNNSRHLENVLFISIRSVAACAAILDKPSTPPWNV